MAYPVAQVRQTKDAAVSLLAAELFTPVAAPGSLASAQEVAQPQRLVKVTGSLESF